MMKHSIELEAQEGVKLGGLLTWAFTFPGTPYFAGYRALTSKGLDLPVLGAFKLLGSLSGSRLPLSSTGAHALSDVLANGVRDQPELDGMATLDANTLRVLLWNYHDELVPAPATPVHLSINVPASIGPYVRVSHLRVDESHGDAYTVWVAQGMPTNPSPAQEKALQQAMAPSALVPDQTAQVTANGTVELDFDLPRFGVSLVTLLPADASNGGAGGAPSGLGGDSSGGAPAAPSSGGCACRSGGVGTGQQSAAQLVLGLLAFAALVRRRRVR